MKALSNVTVIVILRKCHFQDVTTRLVTTDFTSSHSQVCPLMQTRSGISYMFILIPCRIAKYGSNSTVTKSCSVVEGGVTTKEVEGHNTNKELAKLQ